VNEIWLFSLANFALCAAVVVVSICRLNVMRTNVLWRVRAEYAGYIGGAVASGLQPWWSEFPKWGSISLAAALLLGLLCSGLAWKGDKPPDSATSPAPLGDQ